MIIALRKQF
jgi:hypothetical protein